MFLSYYFRFCFFFFNDTATTEIYTLSLHDALPIYRNGATDAKPCWGRLYSERVRYHLLQSESVSRPTDFRSYSDLTARTGLSRHTRDIYAGADRGMAHSHRGRSCQRRTHFLAIVACRARIPH